MSDKIKQFYYKKSRIQQLKGFCYTIQEGSARGASKKMGLDPSTISLQIKSLEDDLGAKLFERQGKKLILNEKGKILYNKAIRIIQETDDIFEDFLLSEDEKYQNSLNIAGFDMIIAELVKYIAIFQKENSKAKISLLNIKKEEAIKGLINREIDIAIYPFWFMELNNIPNELEKFQLAEYKSYWIMHKKHPLAQKELSKITKQDIVNGNLIYIPELVSMKGFKNFIDEYNIKNKIEIKNGTIDFIKKMVSENLGISILAGIYLTEQDKKEFVLKDTEGFFPKRSYGCIINRNKKEITKTFLKILKKNIILFNN
jgi:DNA-binding transcriptional LysR family regulator